MQNSAVDKRVRPIAEGVVKPGPVIYAMARDQRVDDNWALRYAQQVAMEWNKPLIVACPLAADYPEAPPRQMDFLKAGLKELHGRLAALNIPFAVSTGDAAASLAELATSVEAGYIVCDFNPLRESRRWKSELSHRVEIPVSEVDAHNIVPCWEASDKQDYAAYTIRPKINRKLEEFLVPIPRVARHPVSFDLSLLPSGWIGADNLSVVSDLPFKPGEKAALKQLLFFLADRLSQYHDTRNDPTREGQSNLSPYLHFGQLSAQRAALEAQAYSDSIPSLEGFLEELIVRRELSDNFCFYNNNYDSCESFPDWARNSLDQHRRDPRHYLYSRESLEAAQTHDELWNAAQQQMVVSGKMHGYMRMYWAKKILEWSPSPEEALAHAVYLNDRYELDGHDPNGYAGIAWSIGGVHDRAWPEREIFGKIRYMSFDGCKRKFPVAEYIQRTSALNMGATR